jgi:sugar lactone lactonase YvrE
VDDAIEQVVEIPAHGRRFIGLPNDITLDDAGNIYIADIQYDAGFRTGRVLRIVAGSTDIDEWWEAPDAGPDNPSAPAGLAFSATTNTLLITDAARNAIVAVPLGVDDPETSTQILYEFTGEEDVPGLNGITVAPDGTIFVAALGLDRVARLEDGKLDYLAAGFRGGSDLAFDATRNRLFVNNWDQRWLLPVRFLFLSQNVPARLPFSVDVLTWNNPYVESGK